jgi:cytochrome c-type biogenesis protein CcmI
VSAALEIALLAVTVAAAASWVALPLLRPPAQADEQPVRDESRGRLFAALEELGRDRKAGMISPADYAAAVSEIRRRLSQL